MRKNLKRYPKRGEIYIADLNPAFGREIHKKRPVLVISSDVINKNFPTVIMLPFSSIMPLGIGVDTIKVPKKAGLDKDSVILATQIRSIDKSRLVAKVGKLSGEKLEEVEDSLKLVLGMVSLD